MTMTLTENGIWNRTMKIGLLTDTHLPNLIRDLDELGPEPTEFFSSVDLIMHGGDLIYTRVLDWLEQFAPVICANGNNDPYDDHRSEEVQVLEVEGWRIGMVHDLGSEHLADGNSTPPVSLARGHHDWRPHTPGSALRARGRGHHEHRQHNVPAPQGA